MQRLQCLWRRSLRHRAGQLLEFADVGPLSQLKPRSSIRGCLMPRRDVDSSIREVSSESMTEVELRPTSRAWVVHPGREQLPRQPLEVHAVDMTCPAQSTLCKTGVKGPEAQARLEFLLRYMELLHMPQSDPAHHPHTSVMERLKSPLELLRQAP